MPSKAPAASMSRFALGTAQFGLKYGVANAGRQVDSDAVAAILKRASDAGVDTLDTAIAYGNSEATLGKVGVDNWRIVTKLPALPGDVADVAAWVDQQVHDSLRRLHVTHLEGVLLHRPADLLGAHGAVYREALRQVRQRGLANAVGVSIYDPSELSALWPMFRPDIVQAPCNVFDRRIQHSGWMDRLAREGVRLHVRSVFLQGLLLMPASCRPVWFNPWNTLLDRWFAWCAQEKVAPLVAAIGFINSLQRVECYVVGVETVTQLEEIIQADARSTPTPPADLLCTDLELLEPSRWKLT